ncbi:MAG: hypothetical protein MUF00_01660 [Gemmatimonadaceae bacterium]|jgi:hypothetical protein|nr:hypothetical protein [Gemmatimonadaceae bacterium]
MMEQSKTKEFSKAADEFIDRVGISDDRVDFAFERMRGELHAFMFVDGHPSLWMIVEGA